MIDTRKRLYLLLELSSYPFVVGMPVEEHFHDNLTGQKFTVAAEIHHAEPAAPDLLLDHVPVLKDQIRYRCTLKFTGAFIDVHRVLAHCRASRGSFNHTTVRGESELVQRPNEGSLDTSPVGKI